MNKNIEFNKAFLNLLPLLVIVVLAFVVLLGTSYAYLKPSVDSSNTYTMQIGNLEATYEAKSNVINISKIKPVSDLEGSTKSREFVFTIKNTSNVRTSYNIYLSENVKDTEFANVIKFVTKKSKDDYSDLKVLSQDNYIDKNAILDAGEFVTYRVRVWLDEAANDSYYNKDFSASIAIATSEV